MTLKRLCFSLQNSICHFCEGNHFIEKSLHPIFVQMKKYSFVNLPTKYLGITSKKQIFFIHGSHFYFQFPFRKQGGYKVPVVGWIHIFVKFLCLPTLFIIFRLMSKHSHYWHVSCGETSNMDKFLTQGRASSLRLLSINHDFLSFFFIHYPL